MSWAFGKVHTLHHRHIGDGLPQPVLQCRPHLLTSKHLYLAYPAPSEVCHKTHLFGKRVKASTFCCASRSVSLEWSAVLKA